MLRGLLRGERGSGMPILILSMTIVVGSMALSIDGGNAFLERRRLQNAADAAALAGAEALALGGSTGEGYETATDYAVARNGADSVDITVDGGDTVTAVARSTSATIFRGVLGQSSFESAARAVAVLAPVGAMPDGVLPIAVQEDSWEEGAFPIDIWAGGGPGNFGWLGWTGCTDTVCLCESLTLPGNSHTYTSPEDPSDHVLGVGKMVPGSTGVASAECVKAALDALAGMESVTIVMWDVAEGTGAGLEYHAVGFAEFELVDYQLTPQNRITGRFVRRVTPGAGVTTGDGFGVYRVTLME
jgi:hypothetical protein